MLVFTFQENEEAVISIGGEEVRVRFLGKRPGKRPGKPKEAVLGFTAPQTVVIDRLRVHQAKLVARMEAGSPVAEEYGGEG